MIYALFPPIFLGSWIDSANVFTFRMYGLVCEIFNLIQGSLGWVLYTDTSWQVFNDYWDSALYCFLLFTLMCCILLVVVVVIMFYVLGILILSKVAWAGCFTRAAADRSTRALHHPSHWATRKLHFRFIFTTKIEFQIFSYNINQKISVSGTACEQAWSCSRS